MRSLATRRRADGQTGGERAAILGRMSEFRIEDLARRLLESVPPALRGVQQDLEGNFRAVLRSGLARLDLVTRDEFDAQLKVLDRARARLEALEQRVKALEGGS